MNRKLAWWRSVALGSLGLAVVWAGLWLTATAGNAGSERGRTFGQQQLLGSPGAGPPAGISRHRSPRRQHRIRPHRRIRGFAPAVGPGYRCNKGSRPGFGAKGRTPRVRGTVCLDAQGRGYFVPDKRR